MHPLSKYAVPTGVVLIIVAILWWILTPIIKFISPFWPFLAIGIAIGVFIWRIGLEQIQKLIQNPIAKGLATAFLLTCIYGVSIIFIFKNAIPWTQKQLGTEPRLTMLIIIILGAIAIPVFWQIYSATGIPGDPKIIGRGFKVLAIISLIFVTWWNYQIPNRFFDYKTGESKFWIADLENKIYFSEGFSPITGEKLRLGTAKDAEKFKEDSWISSLKSIGNKPAAQAPNPEIIWGKMPITLQGEKMLAPEEGIEWADLPTCYIFDKRDCKVQVHFGGEKGKSVCAGPFGKTPAGTKVYFSGEKSKEFLLKYRLRGNIPCNS